MGYKVCVDKDLCQGHSVCVSEAPEIFAVDDTEGPYPMVNLLLERPGEELRAKAESAAQFCPNGVISIVED